jgi:DNA invertase Pin-like site-specific DNA recombinase
MQIALYARVSTVRQAENELSIPDQLRQMQEWAKLNGHIVVAEYVEPGASATDDKRPFFQQMMADALQKHPVFEAIVVHSHSRFFRDGIEAGVHERKLKRNGVKLFSITQPTSDDASGELVRNIIRMFDGYQSQENAKHTSRAMKENARQGFFNGSLAPFGYMSISTDISGSRGRKKKKLVIHEVEAGIVHMIFDLYLHGHHGHPMGGKEIAKHLTDKGLLMRGRPWRMQKVHDILTDSMYMGEYYFNVRDSRTKQTRPPEEWVKTDIPAIIDAATFEQVRAKRESRSPVRVPPRQVSSPVLLSGLLKCGVCGAGMTLSTGKGGRYRYYKCTNRRSKGNHACTSANIPMDKLDELVITSLADKILASDRLHVMMAELRKRIRDSKDTKQERINDLNRQLKQLEDRQQRLLDAIETGIVELDETTKKRAQTLKASREALLIERSSVSREHAMPEVEYLKPSQVELFGKALRKKLLSKDSVLAKSYLNLLIDEIRIVDNQATIKGSYDALAATIHQVKMGTGQVPTFIHDWRARRDSNS